MASDWEVVQPASGEWETASKPVEKTKEEMRTVPKSGGLLGDAFGFNVGNDAMYKTGNQGLGGANIVGDVVMPRASAVSKRQAKGGDSASVDEAIGILGETASTALPFAGPGGLATKLGLAGLTHGATTPGADLVGRATNAVTEGAIGGALGSAGKVFNAAKNVPYLTKGGTYKSIEEFAQKATQEGKFIKGEDLAKSIRDAVGDKFLKTSDVQKTLNQIISNLPGTSTKNVIIEVGGKPHMMTVPSQITPMDLLNFRQQISKTFGGANFFSTGGEKLAKSVAQQARGPVTEALKELAPQLKQLDKAYGLMSKGIQTPAGKITLGSPATNIARLTSAAILNALGLNPVSLLKKGASVLPE